MIGEDTGKKVHEEKMKRRESSVAKAMSNSFNPKSARRESEKAKLLNAEGSLLDNLSGDGRLKNHKQRESSRSASRSRISPFKSSAT